jgi:hypothetical protein
MPAPEVDVRAITQTQGLFHAGMPEQREQSLSWQCFPGYSKDGRRQESQAGHDKNKMSFKNKYLQITPKRSCRRHGRRQGSR